MSDNTRDKDIQEIVKLAADIGEMQEKFRKLGSMYIDNYSPFKKGDKLLVKPEYGQQENCIVSMVKFNLNSDIEGFSFIIAIPYDKYFKERKLRRHSIDIQSKSEIIKRYE